MKRYWKDAGITVLMIIISLFFVVQSIGFLDVKTSTADPGAGIWPLVALGLILIFGFLNLGSIYLQVRNGTYLLDSKLETSDNNETTTEKTDNSFSYFAAIGLLLIYVALLDTVGFVVLTPLFLILTAWNIGYRDVPKILAFGIGVSLVLQILFGGFFNIALPRGTGVFRQISIYIQNII